MTRWMDTYTWLRLENVSTSMCLVSCSSCWCVSQTTVTNFTLLSERNWHSPVSPTLQGGLVTKGNLVSARCEIGCRAALVYSVDCSNSRGRVFDMNLRGYHTSPSAGQSPSLRHRNIRARGGGWLTGVPLWSRRELNHSATRWPESTRLRYKSKKFKKNVYRY